MIMMMIMMIPYSIPTISPHWPYLTRCLPDNDDNDDDDNDDSDDDDTDTFVGNVFGLMNALILVFIPIVLV